METIGFLFYGYRNFTKTGYEKLAKSHDFEDIDSKETVNLKGKSFMVTGANAGLGFSTSLYFAEHGGIVHMVCRSKEKGLEAVKKIKDQSSNENVHLHLCDVSSTKQIREFVKKFEGDGHSLDVLVNNAGIMLGEQIEYTDEKIEKTLATNTIPTFLLTALLIPTLKKSSDPRVINISSGGALTEKLLTRDAYFKMKKWTGVDSYARTKRHQIALTETFDEKYRSLGIKFYSMHPGWADTEAFKVGMPSFYNQVKNKTRTPAQGADTICWLAISNKVKSDGGNFFRDRNTELKHLKFASTHYKDNDKTDLWNWCCELTNWSEDELKSSLSENSNSKSEIS